MGVNSSRNESATTENLDAQIFLTRKEYEFIILETEVEEAVGTKNKEHLKRIKDELTTLYKTVRILQKENSWSRTITERSDRLLYNYEFVLAKVVSVLNATSSTTDRSGNASNVAPSKTNHSDNSPNTTPSTTDRSGNTPDVTPSTSRRRDNSPKTTPSTTDHSGNTPNVASSTATRTDNSTKTTPSTTDHSGNTPNVAPSTTMRRDNSPKTTPSTTDRSYSTPRTEENSPNQQLNDSVEEYKNDLDDYIRTTEQSSVSQKQNYNTELDDGHVYGIINKLPPTSKKRSAPPPPQPEPITDLSEIAKTLQETDEEEDVDEQLYANVRFQGTISGRRYPILSQIISKPPIPIPRNQQEVIIKEMPKYFSQLNDLLEQEIITEEDVQKVYLIRRKCNEVKDMFVDKANQIYEKYEKQGH